MNNFRRQQFRGGFVTTITALLLVVSVAFSVIGYAASDGTAQQIEAIETRYTTIATMNDQDAQLMHPDGTYYARDVNRMRWRNKNYTIWDDGSIQWEDGSIFYSANVLEEVAKTLDAKVALAPSCTSTYPPFSTISVAVPPE